jgi:tRNA modification GTPase
MTGDTIAAISTPLGEGGIGIVRLSGRDAVSIVSKLFSSARNRRMEKIESHKLVHGFIKDPSTSAAVDEVLVTVMKAPHTYTREDVVEINCHGGLFPLRKVLELTLNYGARLAEPGEFTKRAFLNGRINLSQAEAVIDLINAKTEESARIALEQLSGGLSERIISLRDIISSICAHIEAYIDFPEEEIEKASLDGMLKEIKNARDDLSVLSGTFEEGRFFREGLKVAIVGRPNVGKSSLLNAFLKRDRAIVTDTPGTTRDILEEYLNIKGLPVRIMDTAGIRETHEMAEKEGVARSLKAIADADIVIGIIDGTSALHDEDLVVLDKIKDGTTVIAINKSDLPSTGDDLEMRLREYSLDIVRISARTGAGLGELKDRIINSVSGRRRSGEGRFSYENNGAIITNVRHKAAIDSAVGALDRAADNLKSALPLEVVAVEMRDALDKLGGIVGVVTTDDILNRIFSEFCIGK